MPSGDDRPSAGAPGALLVVEVRNLAVDAHRIPAAIADARRRFPASAVVVRVAELTPDTVRLAQRVTRLRVRGVVGPGEPIGETLRPVLTAPDDLGDDVVEWLALLGTAPSPFAATLLRGIVNRAMCSARVGPLLGAAAVAERTVRHRFHREGLAPPRAWHRLARALHGALRVQAEPSRPLLDLALELGYSDHSGFTRQLVRSFGFTPAGIRGTLGWEWLLHRWWRRTSGVGLRRDASGNPSPLLALAE